MYQALLTRKYLTTKVMPLLASLAVMLCTAMVLIVWSVMGGFLNTLMASGRTMAGDVMITWPTSGFAYYDELIKRLEEQKDVVEAATPYLETFGMVNLPDGKTEGVYVKGIEAESYKRVLEFETSLWWKPLTTPLVKDRKGEDIRLRAENAERLKQVYAEGLKLSKPDPKTGRPRPAAVPGVEMSSLSQRQPEGFYTIRLFGKPMPDGSIQDVREWAPNFELTVTVFPPDQKGRVIDQSSRVFPIANEIRTGVFEMDKRTLLLPLATLQQMLKMDEALHVEPGASGTDAGAVNVGPNGKESFSEIKTAGVDPARVTTVLVRAKEGVSPEALRDRCKVVYEKFAADHLRKVPSYADMNGNHLIRTWEENNVTLVGAVKKETLLVLGILTFISVTASFLILAIFWAMVSEKTKDIGVLRAIGASRVGVAWLWLRYGLSIGIIGSALGGTAAFLVIRNINEIHDWLGRVFNVYVWDPKVYYFTLIPNQVEPNKAAIVLACGVGFSVFGALIPAIKAAYMDPVRALRFE